MFEFTQNENDYSGGWVEKYRPRKIGECILTPRLKTIFQDMVDCNDIGSMHLTGIHGAGKTTVARALCEEVGVDYIIVNMSNDSGIDVVRNRITDYISRASISHTNSDYKVVILDEFDGASVNSQKALRGLIEQYASTARFIMTSNDASKVLPALNSRCGVINFSLSQEERSALIPDVAMRVVEILNAENVDYSDDQFEQILSVTERFYPDVRAIINKFNIFSKSGKLNSFIDIINTSALDELIEALKNKSYSDCLVWVKSNPQDHTSVYQLEHGLYDLLKPQLKSQSSIPDLVAIIAHGNQEFYKCVDTSMQLAETCRLLMNLELKK